MTDFKFYKFQHDDLKRWYFDMGKRGIFDWSPGTGKTIVGSRVIRKYYEEGKKCLVVTPNSLIPDWIENLEKYNIIAKQINKKTKKEQSKPDNVHISNYDALKKIVNNKYDIIVADEVHKAKSYASARSKAFRVLANNCHDLLLMSGTIWQHRDSQELLNYLWCLNTEYITHYIPKNITAYREQYTKQIPGPNNMRWYVSTERGSQLIQEALKRYVMTRVLTDELDMPPFVEKVIKVDSEFSFEEKIKALSLEMNLTLNESYEKPHLSHALMLANGMDFETKELKNDAKLETLMELLDNIPQKDKVIVWYYWSMYKTFITNYLAKAKIPFLVIGPEHSPEQRKDIVDRFKNEEIRVLIAGQGTLAEGFNIQCANYSIFVNIWYDYIKYFQCISRIYRNGQTKKTVNYMLCAKNSMEEQVLTVLKTKMSLEEAKDFLQGTLRDKFKGMKNVR